MDHRIKGLTSFDLIRNEEREIGIGLQGLNCCLSRPGWHGGAGSMDRQSTSHAATPGPRRFRQLVAWDLERSWRHVMDALLHPSIRCFIHTSIY